MTLELEKLTGEIETMAQGAYQRQQDENKLLEHFLQKLREHRTAWPKIERAMRTAIDTVDMKWYRGACPLDDREPLDAAISAPRPPATATVVACDGSQIIPNRHGAYLYSVINVGVIVYHHGEGCAPLQHTRPTLDYPGNGEDGDRFVDKAALVSLRRDLAEIETLVEIAGQYQGRPQPVVALLDQRLLYWPVGSSGEDEGQRVLFGWQQAMSQSCQDGCMLAGYIDRPGKRSVITFLNTLDINEPGFDSARLLRPDYGPRFNDVTLFRRLLTEPGQRSPVFVDVSQHNTEFAGRDDNNEVCFFYLNPSPRGQQIARVDIPRWVAEDPQKVQMVHALVYNQCQIMGDYPYVLARADELAVVGFRDKESLDVMIENAMQRYGLAARSTAKQGTKDVARAGRTRHGM